MKRFYLFFCILFTLFSCSNSPSEKSENSGYANGASTLFTNIESSTSGITFKNKVLQSTDFNFMNYMYIYTGAGIAVGDIDHDGLDDIYFVSNFGPNKLYKNKGDFNFEDITLTSKAEDFNGFSSGVTMLDINNDGWLDIYVCKAGSLEDDDGRRNLLFVNQKNGTFKEDAKSWGIDDPGYSTQVQSIDYDNDGDLDLYVVNHRYDFENNTVISGEVQRAIEEITSDQLYRNDGTHFSKVTQEAGLYNKTWGLSAVVSDFNNDGWDDMYIANDFLEPDVLYINQKDGTFKNEINSRLNHISTNSMGSDYADLNNDLLPDLITLDMLSENYARAKENMATMSTSNFKNMVQIGYHHAYMANMLHYNLGNGKFKETSQLSGIVKTDWSWAPLIADFDNDGLKDIFITNGVDKDYTNQDAKNKLKKVMARGEAMTLDNLLNTFPSEKMANYIFKNNGNLHFSRKMKEWGLETPLFSYGAAYADLDNDGDLDLITNNIDDKASIYSNNSTKNHLQILLKGPSTNPSGIGSKVVLKNLEEEQLQELYLTRGYKSSVSPVLHFGMGDAAQAEEISIQWPDGKVSKLDNIKVNQRIIVDYSTAINSPSIIKKEVWNKKTISPTQLGINYTHQENYFDDYGQQLLLPQKQASKGTGIVKADVNGDGLDDFYVGNAAGAKASLYIQKSDGTFKPTNKELWDSEAKYEDANALFFDADMDGDQDLYVVSAGYNLSENSPLLQDRLYQNDGNGFFTKSKITLPKMLTSGKTVAAADYDGDGDLDLFIGGNVVPGKYPLSPRSFLLKNENDHFIDVTEANNSLREAGMISEAIFTDFDTDNDLDLLLVGEWMRPTFYTNTNGVFEKNISINGLDKTEGWWFSVTASDFDKDGDQDYVIGNIGKNNKFQPSDKKPLYVYGMDFDDNGSFDVALSKINEGKQVPIRGKECSSEQNPFLLDKIGTFKEFASLDMNQIYGEEKLKEAFQLTAHTFETMYLENLGEGNFNSTSLVNQGQTGPTLSIIADDFNKDGNLDIMGIGAIYDAEVETIRYDSNYGYVLLGDGKGSFIYSKEHDPFIDKESKDITAININGKSHYIVVSNNAPLEIFSLKP